MYKEVIRLTTLFITLISFIMIKSIRQFLFFKELKTIRHETTISLEIFYTFIIVYCIFIVGFGLIYFVISLSETILIENNRITYASFSYVRQLIISLYFSGVTLLTIGYGDITPVGIGR